MTDPVNAESAEESAAAQTAEDVSDAALRSWARDNGVEGVPTGGRLSSAWRESITHLIAQQLALDPKAEASADTTSSESTSNGSSVTTQTETTTEETTENPHPEEMVFHPASPATASTDGPIYDPVTGRSVFQPPNTFITSQHFTQP